jgi:hypothetical protein
MLHCRWVNFIIEALSCGEDSHAGFPCIRILYTYTVYSVMLDMVSTMYEIDSSEGSK